MPDPRTCPHLDACTASPAHFDAAAGFSGLAALRAITIDLRTVGIGALPRYAPGCERAMALHEALSASAIESFVLTTCHRTEIYWRARRPGNSETVHALFAQAVGAPGALATASATVREGRSAAGHLLRVCAGLESLVLGEAEILGQVRAALDACTGAGPFLRGIVQAALRAGRMARAETAIGVGALSVASAAVHLLSDTLALPAARVVVVGAGDTGMKTARHLRALCVGQLVVSNRTIARAEPVAAAVHGHAIGLDGLADELCRADAIVCAVAAPSPVISCDDLRRAVAAREGRRLVVVDLSMPPAVEPGPVAGVIHIDLEGLERQVAQQRERRIAEIPRVESVVNREVDRLEAWARQQVLRPLVSDLRRKVEAIRRTELARVQAELMHEAPDADVLDRLSRRLLEQVLAIPLTALEAGDVPLGAAQSQYLRRLFALEPGGST